MDERRDHLDEALDVALTSYGAAPQREGLEQRILSRVSETPSRTHSTGSFLITLAAAAAVIAVCLSWWMIRTTVIQPHPSTTAMLPLHKIEPPPAAAVVVPEPATVLASTGKPHRPRKKTTEPKLSRFPAPSPMTSEERALLELVVHHPKDIPQNLTRPDGPIQPINVAAVEIKPIAFDSYTREK